MCIACELGYWWMLDALDAERRASREKDGLSDKTGFLCESTGEPSNQDLRTAPRDTVESRRE